MFVVAVVVEDERWGFGEAVSLEELLDSLGGAGDGVGKEIAVVIDERRGTAWFK